jgi:hypothetical protein
MEEELVSVHFDDDRGTNTLEVHVSGKLTHDDYLQFVPAFERLVQQYGRVNVLFDMVDFHGWEAEALWDDVRFDIKNFADIDKLAMVGDKAWEKGMSVFCRPFTRAHIRHFDSSDIRSAQEWLKAA